jgi:hypothetical protein
MYWQEEASRPAFPWPAFSSVTISTAVNTCKRVENAKGFMPAQPFSLPIDSMPGCMVDRKGQKLHRGGDKRDGEALGDQAGVAIPYCSLVWNPRQENPPG